MLSSLRLCVRSSCVSKRSCAGIVPVAKSSLPSNLQLADLSVLEPAPKPIIPDIDYYFPSNNVPTTAPVRSFSKPGEFLEDKAAMDKRVFGVAIRRDIVHEVVRYIRNKKRQPHKTKRIGDISGSNKKPHPQKGGGRAQAGNKRNSVWRGGQKAFGPVLRDFSINLNAKVRAMGMMIVLASKFREGNLYIFDKLEVETHKTKDLATILASHGLTDDALTLLVDVEIQDKFERASQNIPWLMTMPQNKANVYDIMKKQKLAISIDALQAIQERLIAQHTNRGKLNAIKKASGDYQSFVQLNGQLPPATTTSR